MLHRAMVLSSPVLLPRTMSESMAKQQLGPELMSMAAIVAESSADAQCLDSHLGPCWCLKTGLGGLCHHQGHSDI